MRQLLTILLALLFCMSAKAQKNITMCHTPTEAFAALASNEEFRADHKDPIAYTHISTVGKSITFKAADGQDAFGYELKSATPSNKYIFVFHEWYGLNDYIKKESEKLYKDLKNVNVIAVDLYDKKLATNAEEAGKLMQAVSTDRAMAIIKGATAYAGKKAEIATIGWCFGGGWSLQASIILGDQAEACVMYYGMPETDIDKLKKLDCDVLGIFGSEDKWINPDLVKTFADNMEKANQDLEYKIFEADHAFANPSNPKYNSDATKEAYSMTLAFLKANLL